MVDIVVPSPGESITEVTLGQWHKNDGDWVETDEVLVDIESDKATLEVRAPAAGVLRVKVKSGAEQKVGAQIAAIDTAAAKPASGEVVAAAPAKAATAACASGRDMLRTSLCEWPAACIRRCAKCGSSAAKATRPSLQG